MFLTISLKIMLSKSWYIYPVVNMTCRHNHLEDFSALLASHNLSLMSVCAFESLLTFGNCMDKFLQVSWQTFRSDLPLLPFKGRELDQGDPTSYA